MLQSGKLRQAEACETHLPLLELLDTRMTTHQKMPLVDLDQTLFQPFPPKLVFQNFMPAQSYKLPLQLFNNDKVSRHVKLEHQESAYFYVEGPKEARSKVAAGLSVTFTVCFTPQESKDYHHTLVFVTEREQFEVPIHAIGPRASLNFRDELHLPVCLVKASTQKTQLVRNQGNRIAIFKLHTESPFSVTPSIGTLDVGESMQVTVAFNPMTTGDHRQDLLLHYDTGEDVHISLQGSCEELYLQLIPEYLHLEKTYISLSNTHTVSLTNSSDTTLKYCWMTWASQQEENLDTSVLKQQSDVDKQSLAQCHPDSAAIHRAVPSFLSLSQGCITVEPAVGEIWPNTTSRFSVVFKPKEAKVYQQTIYCDVTGQKSPIPLTVRGEGLGPEVRVNCNLMDMKNIFIGHAVSYEVQLSNHGLIDAPFELSSPNSTFGQFFSFTPEKDVLSSGACQIVKVTFHCDILGAFSEDLQLTVTGQPRPLTVTFRGCVIGPTFHFDVPNLNFGDVSFGFPKTEMCSLFNTSFVPMTFSLRVVGDGLGSPSVTSDQQVCELCRNNWQGTSSHDLSARPVEFTVSPASGSVRAMSDVSIKVTLCSNTVKQYRVALVVDVEGVGKEIMALPVAARCIVPEIMVETPVLDFQKCFLNYPYEKKARLTNPGSLPVCYGMLEQEYEESPSIIFGSSLSRGVIPPHGSADLPVFLLVKDVGKQHHTLYIALFGSSHSPLEVDLSCTGRGPIVHIQSQQLEFGKIPVLTDIVKTFSLTNQSPVPACFTARMSQGKSPWYVEPKEGEVPPLGHLELRIVAHLKDTLSFQEKLDISVQGSQTHTVVLSATGTGTTIVSDKPISPNLDLGTHFSHGSREFHFKLTNYGQRIHRLYWKSECSSGRTFLPSISASKKKDSVTSGSWACPTEDKPVFSITPTRVELFPGDSVDMLLKGSSDSPKVVKENFVCCGIVGLQGIKEHIMSVEVTCQFVTPMLTMSSQKLNFYIEKHPRTSLTLMYEELVLKNVSSLSLSMELFLAAPFSVCEAQEAQSTDTTKSMTLGLGEEAHLWICFDPTHFQGRLSQVVDQVLDMHYIGHPQKDQVELHAEVHYPNLHFSTTTVDFGSVLNSTENHREVTMTNCSPLPVSYHWACLVDHTHCAVRSSAPSPVALSHRPVAQDKDVTECSVCVQEVFDVLPMYGHLQPGEQQLVTFIFHGQDFVRREVIAQCQVEHGPTYDIRLRGEASEISFSLDSNTVDFGLQRFDQIGESTVILRNTGKVGFKFCIEKPEKEGTSVEQLQSDATSDTSNEQNKEVQPGQPMVIPATGYIDSGSEHCLRVLYLPGIPQRFEERLLVVVAHLPSQVITLTGEGVFPRISLNLPRSLAKESHSDVADRARIAIETKATRALNYAEMFYVEIENMLVTENALAVSKSLVELGNSQSSTKKWNKLSKFCLPEYVLDFGYVVPSQVLKQTVIMTNNGSLPVSLHTNNKVTAGFRVEFGHTKNLSRGESETFTVEFDPQRGNLPLGIRDAVIPIQVLGAPSVHVRLCAVVTLPSISVSTETLQFDTVRCGMCKILTLQLHNHESVPCKWSIIEDVKPVKVDKFLPLHQRSKYLQQNRPPPLMFEMTPSSGMLTSSDRANVQVKFTPAEGCHYKRHLIVHVTESAHPVIITAQGQGEDPHLVFCPPELTMGPCLPFSMEIEAEITVKNPCSYPIEFYSLEFDTQYQNEERILNVVDAYDMNGILLLPPRHAGDSLPTELLEFYKDHCSNDASMSGMSPQRGRHNKKAEKHKAELIISDIIKVGETGNLGTLEVTPISKALARCIDIDLSREGLAALNCRGIAIIIYGAPLTGQSGKAAALATHYGAAFLRVDNVFADALKNGTSLVSLAARHLFNRAAAEHALRMEEAAQISANIGISGTGSSETPTEGAEAPPNSGPTEATPKPTDSISDSKTPKDKGGTRTMAGQGIDKNTLSNLLPEQLLVDILAERFQLPDCYCGIVIYGLDSVYTKSVASCLQVVLKALKNRKHIYVINLYDSYNALKARKRAQRKAEYTLLKEKAEMEEKWLQNMDEDEYAALPQMEKERIIERQKQKKLRILERIRKTQKNKKQLEDIKRLRLEELKKKSKKPTAKESKQATRKKGSMESKQSGAVTGPRMSSKESLDKKEQAPLNEANQSKESDPSHKKDESEIPGECEMPREDKLHSLFSAYERSQTMVEHIVQYWDRVNGLLRVPIPGPEPTPSAEDPPTEKPAHSAKKSKKSSSKVLSPHSHTEPAYKTDKMAEKLSIIPHIVVKLTGKDYPGVHQLLKNKALPPLNEIMDELGLGSSTLAIPPPITLSVVRLPKNRERANRKLNCDCFTFLNNCATEEQDERKEEDDDDIQASKMLKGRNKAGAKLTALKDKKSRESQKSLKRPPPLPKARGLDQSFYSSTPDITEQDQHIASIEQKRNQGLTTFRWVVPANGQVVLKIWFYTSSPGKFEQIFHFELTETQKVYQLLCRGICTYPSFCKDYKILFPYCREVPKFTQGLQKTYVVNPGFYEFGPLLCSKTRDRYKDNRYPENTERLVIKNDSGLETEVQFHFQNDTQATTYLLDPPIMTLQPDEEQNLTVWAYPTTAGEIKDNIVCCIRDNPEVFVIPLSCFGVRPELELESKRLHFNRVLLHRQESRSVKIHNKTPVPISWRLQGMEELGDEFSVSQDNSVILPNTSLLLTMHFMAKKPLNIKKQLRFEVLDAENILGILYTEKIQVSAEAFDIAMDITPDGCLDFGTMKVFEEVERIIKLKNQGKYEFAYKISVVPKNPCHPHLSSAFKVSPANGTLMPRKKFTVIQILCKPKQEISITDKPALTCQVIEPSIGDGGHIVAILPINVSVNAVFSRYTILPMCDINFGPLVFGSKKSQTFTIENNGVFETHFTISCAGVDVCPRTRQSGVALGKRGARESMSEKSHTAGSRMRSEQKDASISQNRLSTGVFAVFPCTGLMQPRNRVVVTVDCTAEQLGSWSQSLLIDISGRDPLDHPEGLPYKLIAEVCRPGIVLDMASIFEEHHLCKTSSQIPSEQFANAERIYVLEENKFVFNKILVGQTAQARFKLTNNSKVPYTLNLGIRLVGIKMSSNVDIFELASPTLYVPSQSHAFAIVSFTPHTMHLYNAVFEATFDKNSRMTTNLKSKVLEFDIIGEGCLPVLSIVRPTLLNSESNPVLRFRRTLVGRSDTLPLVLLNDGNVPAQVLIDMTDKHNVLTVRAAPGNNCGAIDFSHLEDTMDSELQLVHRASLRLGVTQRVELEVTFSSAEPLSVADRISLRVEGNQYSNAIVEVTGEAYQDIITLDNISRPLQETDKNNDVEDNYELLNFGDCYVDCPVQKSFTMTSHTSSSEVVRFEWPSDDLNVIISPEVGHLHAGCSKEVTAIFCSKGPVTLAKQLMTCKLCQVTFQQPLDQVPDWDNQKKTSQASRTLTQQTGKNKMVKLHDEPCCSVVKGSEWELGLLISAVCDFVKFSCSTETIKFKDTLAYKTSTENVQIVNEGVVKLEFSWQISMDPSSSPDEQSQEDGALTPQPSSMSSMALTEEKSDSSLASERSVLMQKSPFTVEPSFGTILPGATRTFCIHFSPLEAGPFKGILLCSIPNLEEADDAPCISICGNSILPYYHFDLEDSDYISGHRRNSAFRNYLNPNIKVIEFITIGLSTPTIRCFTVLNPTSEPYSYEWRCEDTGNSLFTCITPCGTVLPGEKSKVCFKYVAEQVDDVESYWSFVIETLSLSVPFLCVGIMREPFLYFNKSHLDFGEQLVGNKVSQSVDLVNGEEEPFHFTVAQPSLLCDDQQSRLILQPSSGTVAAKDRLPLSVSFSPCREGYVSFRLTLRVKRKSQPLILPCKADCFIMTASVQVENSDGGLRELSPDVIETLDFGRVGISEQATFNILVCNTGRYDMDVNFELEGPSELLQTLVTKPKNAMIAVGDQLQSSVLFSPRNTCTLKDIRLIIKVNNGASFTMALEGSGVTPDLEFSFKKYNFGMHFLYCPGMTPASHNLVIKNKGDRDISVKCQFRKSAFLEIDFKADVFSPGAVVNIPITFYPREPRRYHEKLTFLLNSCIKEQVDILGQGIEMKLEVLAPKSQKVKLGSLLLGQKAIKRVHLVNYSILGIPFNLQMDTKTPLDPKNLSISPAGQQYLNPNAGSSIIEIQFTPYQRIPPFTAELRAEIEGYLHPLLTIQGCCKGVEVRLDQDHLGFGAIVQHCQAKKKVVMMNTGELCARFHWKTEDFPPELSITPTKGCIQPGTEVPVEVTFSPKNLNNDSRYENLSCYIEGFSSRITLTVTGSCIATSYIKEVVTFVCPVRCSHTQTLYVVNPTNQRCSIRPVIKGKQWRAAPSVALEPLQTTSYDITYAPLTMTTDGKKHLGSVFFSFPNGTGMLYTLQGTAEAPKLENTIVHELPAKTHYTQILPVTNWLSKQKRFLVAIEFLKPDNPDSTVSLKGCDYIDVPALSKKDYKIHFYTYKEGQFNAKVTFLNEESGEYLFYIINFKVTGPVDLYNIELVANIREKTSATIEVENPLSTAICLTIDCKCPDISAPSQHMVPGLSKSALTFDYQPLRVGETTSRLSLFCNDLGFFHYGLLLRALPQAPEKTPRFSAPLGNSHSAPIKFLNYSHFKTEFACKTDCPAFIVNKSVAALPGNQTGSQVSVEVCFEPYQLGDVRGQLNLSSGIGGEYVFLLHGVGLPPKTQGPFNIRTGRSVSIPFKNVFLQTTTFSFQVDNPCFTVKKADTIPSKKIHNIQVYFVVPDGGSPGPWIGKLTVSNQCSEGQSQDKICWIYYLKGNLLESS
ncbi:hydrocephalus-inducing protein homolog [Dunckerocampus dactyliophorus]|uniref:hydrocephalus-inducing protein homolog n=1 Tax=Dunckerocampus dactyliophorus TaxID=161453 RepID=UPI002405CED8|nr:hydrocephalus-inducing protein homolog [Dunckerocampus dactyliophorus]